MYYYNLGQYFVDITEEHGANSALKYSEYNYSYAEVNRWVEKLAQILLAKGCRRGDVIAIGHNKQPLPYALMLAGLKLGIAYVNIDVASPIKRNTRILNVSCTKLLFYDDPAYYAQMSVLAKNQSCELLHLDENKLEEVTGLSLEQQKYFMDKVDGETIAYVMFTSGSTGLPKGVAVTHQNVLHFIAWGQKRFEITMEDNFANFSPMYFDNSVFDFYLSLFSGASLTPVSRDLLIKPYDLIAYVGSNSCTIWFSVPTLLIYLKTMKAITAELVPKLRYIVFGGEGYPKSELKKLYDDFFCQAQLVNVYGPTECTCICSAHNLTNNDFDDLEGLPTLGRLNPNFDYKILDAENKESDNGELCLIGPSVAAGYFNDTDRTSALFETLYESNRFMKRMYHTGDLVVEKDGCLHFLGRKDNQIKHMGYRIELEEIEAAVNTLSSVIQSAVVYKRINDAFGKIFCYIEISDTLFDESEAMAQLSRILPEYMLPNKIIVMDELPINSNGKIDRKLISEV